ncbi:MAG TPA: hypothetical protein VGB55_06535 [Tepidisphaeraceae bacterium]|jgi:hypothetical protein
MSEEEILPASAEVNYDFFDAGLDLSAIDDLHPEDRPTVLDRLGPAHFRSKGFSFMGFLQTVYDHIAEHTGSAQPQPSDVDAGNNDGNDTSDLIATEEATFEQLLAADGAAGTDTELAVIEGDTHTPQTAFSQAEIVDDETDDTDVVHETDLHTPDPPADVFNSQTVISDTVDEAGSPDDANRQL